MMGEVDHNNCAPGAVQIINHTVEKLRACTQLDIRSNWHCSGEDLTLEQALADGATWQIATLDRRNYILWPEGKQVLWLYQNITVPQSLTGYSLSGLTLRLALRWWADKAEIFVNGQLVQEGDLFDCFTRIQLIPKAQIGQQITVAIRCWSPGHDEGALVESRLVYEVPDDLEINGAAICPEPGFVADELEVVWNYVTQFEPEQIPMVTAAIAHLDWSECHQKDRFDQSLNQLRETLQPLGQKIKQRHIQFLGHAHLDMAWLWPVAETWEMAERTFASALNLQQDFPDLLFGHSTPALYAWLEDNRPDQFAQIQQQVAAGKWEIIAGLWVEPEFNTVNGESIVRQVLYGQRYARDKFGRVSEIAWLPDSFGFCWQLPQIFQQGGITCFATQKLRWNDANQFPHDLFQWEAPDGTRVLGWTLPPIGEDIQPVKMATYANEWAKSTGSDAAFWLPGIGDHGGGPTRDMLIKAERWQRSPLFPTLNSASAHGYLQDLDQSVDLNALPIWQDELYLEFHRGCYTTHADQKLQNRRCEDLLYQAELWFSFAQCVADQNYPGPDLATAWKTLLFQQFHDILPGSAIPQVFVDANRDWAAVKAIGQQALTHALEALAQHLPRPPAPSATAIPVIVFNSLNWDRAALITLPMPALMQLEQGCHLVDPTGQILPTQLIEQDGEPALLISLERLPSIGYCWVWVDQVPLAQTSTVEMQAPNHWILENRYLKVKVNPETGNLDQVFDKGQHRDVLRGPGNELQAFQDQGQYWDAWNIDPNYEAHSLPAPQLQSINWVEWGPLRWRLRVVRQLGQSAFQQDYVLESDSPLLKIETEVDWRERHVMVKAAFPLSVTADFATYEIPYGAIQRSTRHQTPEEKAKWEVPALRWADLSQTDYGVSLLNDCKYGYDAQPDQLRLTLLRSSTWPDPEADQGHHRFTYALYPHSGSWESAGTVHRGYELNLPPICWTAASLSAAGHSDNVQASASFLDLGVSNFILSALKPAEDNPHRFILRGYECHGQEAAVDLQSSLDLQLGEVVNLLEEPISHQQDAAPPSTIYIRPWQIKTWELKPMDAD